MLCKYCGGRIPDKSNFCPRCGKKSKPVKWKIPVLIFLIIMVVTGIIVGVLKKEHEEKNKMLNAENAVKEALKEELESNVTAEDNIFGMLPEKFVFSSGAGGWGTEISIAKDGTFSGEYYDSQVDTGAEYPNGTVYICRFNGKFSQPEKVDTYKYSMKLENFELEESPGKEYYENGTKYICSEPYGFEDADNFFIYLPGAQLVDLPEEFVYWLTPFVNTEKEKVLPYYGIYNENGEAGFIAYSEDQKNISDIDINEETICQGTQNFLNQKNFENLEASVEYKIDTESLALYNEAFWIPIYIVSEQMGQEFSYVAVIGSDSTTEPGKGAIYEVLNKDCTVICDLELGAELEEFYLYDYLS